MKGQITTPSTPQPLCDPCSGLGVTDWFVQGQDQRGKLLLEERSSWSWWEGFAVPELGILSDEQSSDLVPDLAGQEHNPCQGRFMGCIPTSIPVQRDRETFSPGFTS